MDKVNTPARPQGHKVKNEVTKVIAFFSPFFSQFFSQFFFQTLKWAFDNSSPNLSQSLTTRKDFDRSVGRPRMWNRTTLRFSINAAFVADPISLDMLVRARIMQLSEYTQLTIPQNIVGPEF